MCLLCRHFTLILPRLSRSPLFPYTTLFRSCPSPSRTDCPAAGRSFRSASEQGPDPPSPCAGSRRRRRSEEHTSELQSRGQLVCRLLLEKKNSVESVRMPYFAFNG